MAILDQNNLLSTEEHKAYASLLKLHGHDLHHFLLEVEEDQRAMDMNDLNYVVIVRIKANHVKQGTSNVYYSRAGSGTWLEEFDEDLKRGYFSEE